MRSIVNKTKITDKCPIRAAFRACKHLYSNHLSLSFFCEIIARPDCSDCIQVHHNCIFNIQVSDSPMNRHRNSLL